MGNGDDGHLPVEPPTATDDDVDKLPAVSTGEAALDVKQPTSLPEGDVDMVDASIPAEITLPTLPVEPTSKPEQEPVAESTSEPSSAPITEAAEAAEAAGAAGKQAEESSATGPSTETAVAVEAETTAKPDGDAQDRAKDEDLPTMPSQDTTLPSTSEVDLQPASMSQLAIETSQADTSPLDTTVEVSMSDAPSVKLAREREEDAAEEPAAKRAKTEPEEELIVATDTVTARAPTETSADIVSTPLEVPPAAEAPPLSSLSQWEDAEVGARPLTPYRRREIRKVLARVKKTKSGNNFRDSVQKLWPFLWDAYAAKIEKPMDLGELERILRDPESSFKTLGDFRYNLGLIFENTLAFNGPTHDVTQGAAAAIKSTWNDVRELADEEPVKPKPVPKSKPIRESRTQANADAAVRRQSTGPGTSPAGDAIEAKPHPVAAEQPADLRRASIATEGDRPKRTVRAPKPKDIDYTPKPSRKKLKPELQFCDEVLTELMHSKHEKVNTWFLEPVDAEGLNIPEYYSIIKKPMDLGKVSRMITSGDITSLKDFEKNVRLVVSNCYAFNGPADSTNPVSEAVKGLEDLFNSLMKNKDAWMAKHAKSSARAPASFADSDEDEEDEDGDEDDAATHSVDPSKEVRDLEAKLREESEKLTNMFTSTDPNPSMIGIQQGILNMVQQALLKAKQNQNDRQKQDKPGKKAGKGGKAKGAGGGRKSTGGGGSQQKKAGGPKKATKRTLTPADKDQIANAINDLEYGHLERAIDIIKRDTGQAVSFRLHLYPAVLAGQRQ